MGPSDMTLRDWFAGQALAGFSANKYWDESAWETVATAAYNQAAAMLGEREKREEAERLRKAAPSLLEACRLVVQPGASLTDGIQACKDAIAAAESGK